MDYEDLLEDVTRSHSRHFLRDIYRCGVTLVVNGAVSGDGELFVQKEGEPGVQEHVTLGNWHLRFHLLQQERKSTDFTFASFSS